MQHAGGLALLKVFTDEGNEEEMLQEADHLLLLHGTDVAPALLGFCTEPAALLLAFVQGGTLQDLLK